MPNPNDISDIHTNISKIVSYESSISEHSNLDEFDSDTTPYKKNALSVISAVKIVKEFDLNSYTAQGVHKLKNQLSSCVSDFKTALEFNAIDFNQTERKQRVEKILESIEKIQNISSLIFSHFLLAGEFHKVSQMADGLANKAENEIFEKTTAFGKKLDSIQVETKQTARTAVEHATAIVDKSKEIDTIMKQARSHAYAEATSNFSEDYLTQAKVLKKGAKSWLIASIAIALSALAILVLFAYFTLSAPIGKSMTFDLISTKILIVAPLLTASLWCGRIYKAQMHQSSNYHHQALVIKTLTSFRNSVENPTIQDALTHEAARSAFSPPSSGYIENKGNQDNDLKILEIFKHNGG